MGSTYRSLVDKTPITYLDIYHDDYDIMVEHISQQNRMLRHVYVDGVWRTNVPPLEYFDNETEYSDDQNNN